MPSMQPIKAHPCTIRASRAVTAGRQGRYRGVSIRETTIGEERVPVEFGVWRVDGATTKLPTARLPDEKRLEDLLEQHPDVVGLDVLVLGRQVPTAQGGFIDLLGMDRNGDFVVIERDRTPREVVAQTLDYGSWVRTLDADALAALYAGHVPDGVLDGGFAEHFDAPLPETLNARHQLVIVASELDPSTERIVRYLFDEYGVRINVLFFRYFVDGDRQYRATAYLQADVPISEVITKSQGAPSISVVALATRGDNVISSSRAVRIR